MRLLNVNTLTFTEFNDGEIPVYIIASHRWLAQEDETTYKDVLKKKHLDTPGYKKVEAFCAFIRKAKVGVEWLWIDTCCINKDSSTELQESINSMFRWYKKSACCLAFLADVKANWNNDGDEREDEEKVQEEFKGSVWFTRAWTLQELLAPTTVIFVNASWKILGYKGRVRKGMKALVGERGRDLTEAIHERTGIRRDVLYDYKASRGLSFEEKQEWVVERETTREEDKAYCLLGIFNISMPLVYGEGRKAQKRLLKEIREREWEWQAKRERKGWKGKVKKMKRIKGAGDGLEAIPEEQALTAIPEYSDALESRQMVALIPPTSEYEVESTKEHRHAAIVSFLRIMWLSTGSRDEALSALANDLERLGYVEPGEAIHSAIHFVSQRAQQAQSAYYDMIWKGWTQKQAMKQIIGVLQQGGHGKDASKAIMREYLMYDALAVDASSLPYIPSKRIEATKETVMEEPTSDFSEKLQDTMLNFSISSDIPTERSEASVDVKLSGPGVQRQATGKSEKEADDSANHHEERHAMEESFDRFAQMHLFC